MKVKYADVTERLLIATAVSTRTVGIIRTALTRDHITEVHLLRDTDSRQTTIPDCKLHIMTDYIIMIIHRFVYRVVIL